MKYIWLKTVTEEDRAAIDRLKADCLAGDGRLPLLNLPEQPEECDGCLAAVAEECDGSLTAVAEEPEIRGILTCLYSKNTVEVCILVHPEFRGRGIGIRLLHQLIRSTPKIPVFPVAADDAGAMAFLNYIGKREICREMLMILTRKSYSDVKPEVTPRGKKKLRVTCRTVPMPESEEKESGDRQMKYTLYLGMTPVGRCLVTGGCISDVWIGGSFRQRGFGSFLLRTVIRHQFSLGRRKMLLHVTSLNPGACALYRKYGFVVTEEVVYYS